MAGSRLLRVGSATAALAALLAGCATERPAPLASSFPPAVATPAALDPESYVAFAASSALFAVRASNFAEGRGSTNKIKKFASQLVLDQTAIGVQLNFAGRRIDLLPSSRPLPQHQAMLEQLATTSDFDNIYRRQMASVLAEAEAVHRAFEARGSSATLRPVAAFAGPTCAKNLEQLRKL